MRTEQVQHPTDSQYGSSKPEVVQTTCERPITCSISSALHYLRNKFLRLNPFFRVRCSSGVILIIIRCKVSGSQKTKMVVFKHEIRLSPLVHKIATKFQHLYPYFGVQLCNGTIGNAAQSNQKKPEVENSRWLSILEILISQLEHNIAMTFQRLYIPRLSFRIHLCECMHIILTYVFGKYKYIYVVVQE